MINNKGGLMMKRIVLALIVLFLVVSCSTPEKKIEEKFLKAQELQKSGKYHEAINLFKEIISKSAKNKYTAQSQFMIGFILAENLKEYDSAKIEFEKFIKEYPDNPLVKSAKWEIDNMGKPLDSIPFLNDTTVEDDTTASNSEKK